LKRYTVYLDPEKVAQLPRLTVAPFGGTKPGFGGTKIRDVFDIGFEHLTQFGATKGPPDQIRSDLLINKRVNLKRSRSRIKGGGVGGDGLGDTKVSDLSGPDKEIVETFLRWAFEGRRFEGLRFLEDTLGYRTDVVLYSMERTMEFRPSRNRPAYFWKVLGTCSGSDVERWVNHRREVLAKRGNPFGAISKEVPY
jgi:hypothetical protein